jgi:2'-5' RNA ligase
VKPDKQPTRRLFFALWPDESMQLALAHAGRSVIESSGGREVPAHNLHLTLVFLGSVAETRIAELGAIASRVAGAAQLGTAGVCDFGAARVPKLGGACLEVTLDRIEHWKKAQIVCATAGHIPGRAATLADELKRELVACGFAPDLKPFRPHVTLARKVQRVTRELAMPPTSWAFRHFRLVESRSDPGGSIYSSHEVWALDGMRDRTREVS